MNSDYFQKLCFYLKQRRGDLSELSIREEKVEAESISESNNKEDDLCRLMVKLYPKIRRAELDPALSKEIIDLFLRIKPYSASLDDVRYFDAWNNFYEAFMLLENKESLLDFNCFFYHYDLLLSEVIYVLENEQ